MSVVKLKPKRRRKRAVRAEPAKVLSIEPGGWLSGEALCGGCGHTWVAVRPVGTIDLECPKCRRNLGAARGNAMPDVAWQCHCGNELFWLLPNRVVMCRICGVEQSGWDRPSVGPAS